MGSIDNQMDEDHERYLNARKYLDRKADKGQAKENRIIETLFQATLFVTGCVCGALLF